MEYRRLGNSGLKVSTLCLSAMMFGERTTEDVAARIVDSALDAGVNFIDTADGYAKGASETHAERRGITACRASEFGQHHRNDPL